MDNFSPREAFPPPVFLLFLYLSPSSIAKVGGYGGLFSLWNRPPFPALVSYSRSPCQSPWTHCLGRNGSVLQQMTRWVCEVETCRKAPFSWEIVLSCFGRLQCCFFFFCPAEEVWVNSGKHLSRLLKRCGSKIDSCPIVPVTEYI